MTTEQAIAQLEELQMVEDVVAADEAADPACAHNRYNSEALTIAIKALRGAGAKQLEDAGALLAPFPHLCQDEHPPVRWSGDGEMCPVCVAKSALASPLSETETVGSGSSITFTANLTLADLQSEKGSS